MTDLRMEAVFRVSRSTFNTVRKLQFFALIKYYCKYYTVCYGGSYADFPWNQRIELAGAHSDGTIQITADDNLRNVECFAISFC
jgi:hypothetical protein